MTDSSLSALAAYFREFAKVHAAPISPLYAALASFVAEDEDLLCLAARATPGQPPANLLFGAVHLMLLEGNEAAGLAAYYPSLGGTKAPDPDVGPLFKSFVRAHEAQIGEIVSTRITNTNEVNRAALLLPAFQMVAREAGAPLYLVEIGPSCGLVLCWDKYRYRYGKLEIGDSESEVLLMPEVRGELPPLDASLPAVFERVGMEKHPADLGDPETIAWQKALIWPEHRERAERLERAFGIARATPLRMVHGDAAETLGPVLAAAAPGTAICVYHSFVTYQIPKDGRAALSDQLRKASQDRPVWRIGLEWTAKRNAGPGPAGNALGLASYRTGQPSYQHLALCDPHGRWIEWGPTPPEEADRL